MWPNKKGTGSKLGYGVRGNGSLKIKELDPNNDGKTKFEPYLEFPRIRNEGLELNRVEKGFMEINPEQISDDYSGLKPSKSTAFFDKHIPRDLMKALKVDSNMITSSVTHDPTYGDLVCFFDIKSGLGVYSSTAMAYVTGEVGSILNVGVMKYQRRTILHKSKPKKVLFPHFPQETLQIHFSEPIKQIEFCKVQDNFDTIHPHLAVRTDSKVVIIKVLRGIQLNLKLSKLTEISVDELEGYSFVDASFNHWNGEQLAVVDVRGNFGVWRIQSRESKTAVKRVDLEGNMEVQESNDDNANTNATCRPSIYDPSELSHWKKIVWCYDGSNILLISRSTIIRFSLLPYLSSKKIITSKSWSKIRDFKLVTASMNYAFLLTSKEIILVHIGEKLDRVLAWKHFLLDSDPSLKINVTEYDDDSKFLCSVYSEVNPLIFIYNFGFIEDKAFSLRDPYFIERSDKKSHLRQFFISELNKGFFSTVRNELEVDYDGDIGKLFGVFELGNNLKFTMEIRSEKSGIFLRKPLDFNIDYVNFDNGLKQKASRYFNKLSKSKLSSMAESLKAGPNKDRDEIDLIQAYAFKLGEKVQQLSASKEDEEPKSLSIVDISKDLPLSVTDLNEFDCMIDQLIGYYKQNGVNISNIGNQLAMNDIFKNLENTNSLKNLEKILKDVYLSKETALFNHGEYIRQVALLLSTCSMKATLEKHDPNYYESKVSGEIEDSDKALQDILESWDLNSFNETQIRESQSNTPSLTPTINLSSQSSTASIKKKKSQRSQKDLRHQLFNSQIASQKKDNYAPTYASQLSQAVYTASQDGFGLSQESEPSSSGFHSPIPLSSQALSQSQGHLESSNQSQKRMPSLQSSQRKKKKKKSGFA